MKKTILHIIYNLGRGGAETMLVTVVRELKEYNNIVVTLFDENHFGDELQCRYISLNLKSLLQLPYASIRLRKIIVENKVDIVHSHLFWPTILARVSTPKKIPLITTIHAFIATSIEYKKRYVRLLDKISYRFRKSIIIVVAEGALQEYFSVLKVKPYKAYVLYTFADDHFFKINNSIVFEGSKINVISVGALRQQKNYPYLIEAFQKLNPGKFELHIYGIGPLQKELEELIIKVNAVNVFLKGEINNMEKVLSGYNLYVMSSSYEGFSLSVLEAMASGVPLLLSDISSFREQCQDVAEYFNLNNINDFVRKINNLTADKEKMKIMSIAGWQRVSENFTLDRHMKKLRLIYQDALQIQ